MLAFKTTCTCLKSKATKDKKIDKHNTKSKGYNNIWKEKLNKQITLNFQQQLNIKSAVKRSLLYRHKTTYCKTTECTVKVKIFVPTQT
jgi:hypothetical protein